MLRQQNEGGPLYMSLLNWDYRDRLKTEVVVAGEYDNITDLSISGSFPVPAKVENGITRFRMQFGPGEGVMLQSQAQ